MTKPNKACLPARCAKVVTPPSIGPFEGIKMAPLKIKWAPLINSPRKRSPKKRWKPEVMKRCWFIDFFSGEPEVQFVFGIPEWTTDLGFYRTKSEALAMRRAIIDFVTKKIGGV